MQNTQYDIYLIDVLICPPILGLTEFSAVSYKNSFKLATINVTGRIVNDVVICNGVSTVECRNSYFFVFKLFLLL